MSKEDELRRKFEERQRNTGEEQLRWNYIIATFWQLPPDSLLALFKRYDSFDALYEAARRERDGMIAT